MDELCQMFPSADIYTLFYRPQRISATINCHRIFSSFLSRIPGVEKFYRHLLPIYPLAVRDLSRQLKKHDYDLVISVSHCVVKNIQPKASTPHLCYCLTPARYFWDQFDAYFSRSILQAPIRAIIERLRIWDKKAAVAGTRYVAISSFIQDRIRRVLNQESTVVYPPVRSDWIQPRGEGEPGEGFLCVNALVPYKRVELIVQAFNILGEPLLIVGDGPELAELQAQAKENIKFIRHLDDSALAEAYRGCKALVFAAVEDFGIIPVEVQAAGRPVICLAAGGALETVRGPDRVSVGMGSATGMFFSEPSAAAIVETIYEFLRHEAEFSLEACLLNAETFSVERFRKEILLEILQLLKGENSAESLLNSSAKLLSPPWGKTEGLSEKDEGNIARGNE